MIEAALEREANLSPELKRHAQFERVVCLASSAPMVVRIARGEREGESEGEGSVLCWRAWSVRRQPTLVAPELCNLTSLTRAGCGQWRVGSSECVMQAKAASLLHSHSSLADSLTHSFTCNLSRLSCVTSLHWRVRSVANGESQQPLATRDINHSLTHMHSFTCVHSLRQSLKTMFDLHPTGTTLTLCRRKTSSHVRS